MVEIGTKQRDRDWRGGAPLIEKGGAAVSKKRMTPREHALNDRIKRVKGEVRARFPEFNPDTDELTYDWFAGDFFVNVWIDGTNVAQFIDRVDDIEGEMSNPARLYAR